MCQALRNFPMAFHSLRVLCSPRVILGGSPNPPENEKENVGIKKNNYIIYNRMGERCIIITNVARLACSDLITGNKKIKYIYNNQYVCLVTLSFVIYL